MRRTLFILGLAVLSFAAGAPAQDGVPSPFDGTLPPTERLEALAEQIRRAHEALVTLEAEFSQIKESALLLEPDRSEGEFSYAAPDRVRWEYSAPEPISLVIADRLMTTWYRDIARVEKAQVGEQSDRVLRYLGAGTSLDTLMKYFTVAMHLPPDRGDPLRLELLPRFKRVAKRIQGMDLWLHPTLFLPVRLKYVEGDGDVTEYEFWNFRRNEGIPKDRFELDLPQDVEVREVHFDSRAAASGPR
ncbi:MAG: outer membrane lipoprotein carrier protein LolA [bacterium]|nr:outer membrane lipoprotein carrier protein LolA [bacterium]